MEIKSRKKKLSLFVDSGAVSLHNYFGRKFKGKGSGTIMKERHLDSYDYIKKKEYKEYRNDYIKFIKDYEPYIDVYCNLDVIFRPKETYDNQKYLESKGINPLPVWHVGVDEKWLLKYLDEGYDYIGIGGITPNPTNVMIPVLDRLFKNILCDSNGMPKAKYHGLAVTGVPLMVRYPWYSVDSTSWLIQASYGNFLLPKRVRKGEYNFLEVVGMVRVSSRAPAGDKKHYNNLSKMARKGIDEYLDFLGLGYGESEFRWEEEEYKPEEDEIWWGAAETKGKHKGMRYVEKMVVKGVCNYRKDRAMANVIYFKEVEKQLPKWPWAFKLRTDKPIGFDL